MSCLLAFAIAMSGQHAVAAGRPGTLANLTFSSESEEAAVDVRGAGCVSAPQEPGSLGLFDEVYRLCLEHFYNPKGIPDWEVLRAKYRSLTGRARSLEEAAAAINRMLAESRTSHTHLYTRYDWEYYDLLDIFKDAFEPRVRQLFPDGRIVYPSIGIFTRRIRGKTFVKAVLDGGPAFKAGIMPGDEISQADGKEYNAVRSFAGKAGQRVAVRIQRSPDPRSAKQLVVIPEETSPRERYLQAMKVSVRVIEDTGFRIGYIHVWSFAGEQYYLQLLKEMQGGDIRDADALILDLREGWGGANPYYLSPFDPDVPTEVPSNNGKTDIAEFKWRKPVVLLINEGTRSGKETLAYNFKQSKLGKLVGVRTAGANLPGRPFLLEGGSLLILAVRGSHMDIKSIEGRGVVPDIAVEFPLEYAQGRDPQLRVAIEAAIESARRTRP